MVLFRLFIYLCVFVPFFLVGRSWEYRILYDSLNCSSSWRQRRYHLNCFTFSLSITLSLFIFHASRYSIRFVLFMCLCVRFFLLFLLVYLYLGLHFLRLSLIINLCVVVQFIRFAPHFFLFVFRLFFFDDWATFGRCHQHDCHKQMNYDKKPARNQLPTKSFTKTAENLQIASCFDLMKTLQKQQRQMLSKRKTTNGVRLGLERRKECSKNYVKYRNVSDFVLLLSHLVRDRRYKW